MSSLARQWIGGLAFIAVLTILAAGVIGWRTHCVLAEHRPAAEAYDFSKVALNADQRSRIDALERAYRTRVSELCNRHCEAKMNLAGLLTAEPRDEKAIRAKADEVSKYPAECERLTADHVLAVAAVLPREESAKFLKRYADEIESTCAIADGNR